MYKSVEMIQSTPKLFFYRLAKFQSRILLYDCKKQKRNHKTSFREKMIFNKYKHSLPHICVYLLIVK